MAAVKNNRTDVGRASARYLRLVEALGAEEGAPAHGWVSRVARRLGVTQGYLSRLYRGERAGGTADVVAKAVDHLGIRREYFTDIREPVSWRDYLGTEPAYPAWREFISSPTGADVTDQEREALASFLVPDGGEPSVAFYEGVLHMMRARISRAELGLGLERAKELHARLQQKRRADARRGDGDDES